MKFSSIKLSLPPALRPAHRRSFPADFSLALIPLLLWFLADSWQADIAASRERFQLAVAAVDWEPRLRWVPLLLATAGLLGLAGRQYFSPQVPMTRRLRLRLVRAGAVTAGLLGMRLLTLWDPLLHLFPFLSLLWSPHVTWTLGLFYLLYLGVSFHPAGQAGSPAAAHRRIALLLFLGGLLVYGTYTLYYCQVTMLHGDEGQYLRVTQSLLRDGDMDLANNLDTDHTDEFHVLPFGIDKAPASPPGKVYSVHPVGLSVLLLPAYWLGLEQWANPRLSTALFMTLVAAACLPLAFLWLIRLHIGRATALAAVLIMAATAPFFLFTNQLFPEVPALCITFCLLFCLAHWQIPDGRYRSLGRLEPLLLGGLTLLLGFLPFLHPRYAPLAGLGGLLLLWQAWHNSRRGFTLGAVGLGAGLSLCALIFYNFAYSGDWLGPIRPGNAWEEGALDISTWAISLPGHWIYTRKGILNISPIFFFSLVGAVDLARRRDRRLGVLLLVYGATAAVNGLHADWGFGFCYPARYLVTALPTLLLGLAWALPILVRRGTGFFLAIAGLVIGLDSVYTVFLLPELGFDGRGLLERSFNSFYPWQTHFFPPGQADFPLFHFSFWLLLLTAASLVLIFRCPARPLFRGGLLLLAALLPFLWGQSATFIQRLSHTTILFPYFLSAGKTVRTSDSIEYPVHLERHETGEKLDDGGFAARAPDHEWGVVASTQIHVPLRSAFYHLEYPELRLHGSPGQVVGHLLFSRRYTVSVVSPWAEHTSWPLVADSNSQARTFRAILSRGLSLGYAYAGFSGFGGFSFAPVSMSYAPVRKEPDRIEVTRFPIGANADSTQVSLQVNIPWLGPGVYTARFLLKGSTFSAFFQRRPASIIMAAYTGPVPSASEADLLETRVQAWFEDDREQLAIVHSPNYIRPQVEVIQAPWWLAIPFAGDEHFEFNFLQQEPRNVWLMLRYAGELDLHVEEIVLYKRETSP